jgi:hypothetical protein
MAQEARHKILIAEDDPRTKASLVRGGTQTNNIITI